MSNRPTPVSVRRVSLGLVIAILLLAAWKLPILESVAGIAVLEPTAVWFVAQDGRGQIKTGWEENYLGGGSDQTLIEFSGSDIIRIEVNPMLREGFNVAAGDTVVTILSLATESAIGELEAELLSAKASYEALIEGSRPVDIEVAKRKVEFADASLKAFQPEYERKKDLHLQGFVSPKEFEQIEGEFASLQAARRLAESNYEALKTGARPIEVEVAAAEVTRLELMLNYARQRHELRRVLTSPFSGIARFGDVPGDIIRINRTDTLAACVDLPETMLADIKPDARVEMTLAIDGRVVSGQLHRIIFRRTPLRASTVVGLIDNRDGSLIPGMHGHGDVETTPRSLLSSVNKTLRSRLR